MIRLALWSLAVAALLTLSPVLSPAREVSAGIPTDQLKGAIDRVVKTLEDPAFKGDAKAFERRRAVRKIADDIFDFNEISRRALARHWQTLNDKQREEFVGLFADLLERSYISKIELYGGEKILYTNERVDGDVATVATKIISKSGTDIPVDYRMAKRGTRWLVYDVNIEGVSLVSNYRTQFNKIIQTASYDELVQKLRTKQDELVAEEKKTPAKK